MIYDPRWIFLEVMRCLEIEPSISLNQLSDNLGIERHTVEKAVRNATGINFRELRTSILLKRACDLLTDKSNLTVKEVAFILGYKWQGSFSRFLKRAMGCSPKEFKLQNL